MKKTISLFFIFSFSFFTHSSAQIITTVAGGGISTLGDSGQATAANLDGPVGIALDKNGNIYFSDSFHSRIRKVDASSGIITTYAGNGMGMSSGDGGQATAASLVTPEGIAFDTADNLYIADENAEVIRKVNYRTGIITTVAGNGYSSSGEGWFYGDGGPATAAELDDPQAVGLDKRGSIYIADYFNNRIRKVDTTIGIITTIVGNGYGTWVAPGSFTGSYTGDGGQATLAELYGPGGVCIDDSGNIIISDCYNNVVRKVTSAGIITTIAGNGIIGYSGDQGAATAAELWYPTAYFDNSGNIYIADGNNNVIRLVTKTTGIITTIAGTGRGAFGGDGGPATAAYLDGPPFVVVDDSGNYYIADLGNNRVRKVTKDTDTVTGITKLRAKGEEAGVFPNPSNGVFNLSLSNVNEKCNVDVYNVLGEKVYDATLKQAQSDNSINIGNQPNGIYFYRVITEDGSLVGEGKVVIER